MDEYKMILVSNNQKKDITHLIKSIEWEDSLDTLGMRVTFSIARNYINKYFKDAELVKVGNGIVLLNKGQERFRGLIVTEEIGHYEKKFDCFDFAFWLNKSKTIKQFNKVVSSKAIKQVCDELKIPVQVKGMSTKISKIYKDKEVSEILKDIIDQEEKTTGKKYRMEMREGKLCIEPYKNLKVKARYQIATNTGDFDATLNLGNVSKTLTIENMVNSVLVTSSEEKSVRVVAKAQNKDFIQKFGLLQNIESVDKKDKAKAQNIANNKLKELCKIGESISIEILGSDGLRSGRIIEINNKEYDLKGGYLIKDCKHSYINKIHKCSATIERVI